MLIIGYSRAAAPARDPFFDDFSSDRSATYAVRTAGAIAHNAALGTLDYTMGSTSFDGVLSPLFPVSTSKVYRVEVDVSNTSASMAADFSIGDSAATPGAFGTCPIAQRAPAGQTKTMVIDNFAPPAPSILIYVRFRGGPAAGDVLRVSRIQVAEV